MDLTEDVQMEMLPSVAHSSNIASSSPVIPSNKDCVYTFSDNCDSDEGEELKYKIKNIVQSPPSDAIRLEEPSNDAAPQNVERKISTDIQDSGGEQIGRNYDNGNLPLIPIQAPEMPPSSPSNLQSCEPIVLPTNEDSQLEFLEAPSTSPPSSLPIRPRRATIPNGVIPKSGKPLTFASNLDRKSASTLRGRSKPKRKALVAMYQSQISDNKIGIKLKLKKSDFVPPLPPTSKVGSVGKLAKSKKTPKSANRKRTKRGRARHSSEDDDYSSDDDTMKGDKRMCRAARVNNNAEPEEQSRWGEELPFHILVQIFGEATRHDGALPTLMRLSRVCSSWREAAMTRSLWQSLELARWTKEKSRTELHLKWFIENRLSSACTDINLSNWKVTNVLCVLSLLAETCPRLEAITLTGWKEFSSDHLIYLAENFTALRRLDLSAITMELNPVKSSVGLQSMCNAIQIMGERLTHLYLAHNRLSGIPQISVALSTYCPNLLLLDLSNVSTVAVSHGILPLEKIQMGCTKLKVLRITNSHIMLGAATLQEQMESPGFPDLEELSIASLTSESRIINDEYLQRILKTSTKLELLDVRGSARLTHQSLIRLPTWAIKHLFLSGCSVTRDVGSGLELIASKWAHSLIEFDLAWANDQESIDSAIRAIADKGADSPLNHLNLCGSSVSVEAVKEILINCPFLTSINLSSCRGLPRGVKRLMQGATELQELRENLGVTPKFAVAAVSPSNESFPPPTQNVTPTTSPIDGIAAAT